MNYDVTHEHCHNRQKREERKPVDLRWMIHIHTIAPERPLSSINIYMLSFKQFLIEQTGRTPGKPISDLMMWGIDVSDKNPLAGEKLEAFAERVGYKLVHGPNYTYIVNPKTNHTISRIRSSDIGDPSANLRAARNIDVDLIRNRSDLRSDMNRDQVNTAFNQSRRASFPLASIGAAGIAGAGAMVGSVLTQGAQAASNAMGGLLTMPPARTRMEREKDLQSDVGLAFDLDADNELMASPEGFRAVAARQKEGRGFPTALPTEAGIQDSEEDYDAVEELPSQFSPTKITPGRKSPIYTNSNAYDPSLEEPTVAEPPRSPYPSRLKKVPQVNPMNLDPTMEELPPMNPEKERRRTSG